MSKPLVVGIGGTTWPGSSTEQALKLALSNAKEAGACVQMFGSAEITTLPHYLTPGFRESSAAVELIHAIRRADGIIIASPGYHGSISGLVKNAIDYIEETAKDDRVYLDGVPVGLITTAFGWQATGSTLATLRAIVHALRGWPTPLGCAINTSGGIFKEGACLDERTAEQLNIVGTQVYEFARLRMSGSHIRESCTERAP